MKTLVQISDTHLRSGLGPAAWQAAADLVRLLGPDLVVHTGDIVYDDALNLDDHHHAARELASLGAEMLAVPGNHDVGDGPPKGPGPDPAMLSLFPTLYSPPQWVRHLDDWCIIGADTMSLGTGTPQETAAAEWLGRALDENRRKNLAVFTHKPPFVMSPDETDDGSAAIPVAARSAFWSLLRRFQVRLVGCGHRHEYRVMQRDGVAVVWAPTTSPLLDERSPPFAGHCFSGIVEYAFVGDTVMHRVLPLGKGTA